MKNLKKIVVSLFFALSVAGVSTVAFASEGSDGAEQVIVKINEAKAAITAGKSNTDVASLVADAKGKGKTIRANDKMAGKIQRAAQHLSKALGALKENDSKLAADHLNEGEEAFKALKSEL